MVSTATADEVFIAAVAPAYRLLHSTEPVLENWEITASVKFLVTEVPPTVRFPAALLQARVAPTPLLLTLFNIFPSVGETLRMIPSTFPITGFFASTSALWPTKVRVLSLFKSPEAKVVADFPK
ncbi:unannotated protein [freshwater metagenome]|uniref:Unannotated protein n=1 Tax=freshwater metagenome TaxID=449393 RepID=A0A6J6RP39_9ZZZZ